MDWIFDHFQILLAVAGMIAYWLNQRHREKQGEAADYDGDGIPENQPRNATSTLSQEAEEEERTRKIQEEIRRRIAERNGERTEPAPTPVPPPLPVEETIEGPATVFTRREEPADSPYANDEVEDSRRKEQEAIIARQREITEQMAALVARRRAAEQEATQWSQGRASAAYVEAGVSSAVERGEHSLMKDLRGARNLRRAMALREVLGPPVSLK